MCSSIHVICFFRKIICKSIGMLVLKKLNVRMFEICKSLVFRLKLCPVRPMVNTGRGQTVLSSEDHLKD